MEVRRGQLFKIVQSSHLTFFHLNTMVVFGGMGD